MLYRVRLDLAFTTEAEANKMVDIAKTQIAKSTSINETKDNAETSFYEIHKCYHDEVAPKPCETIARSEMKFGVVSEVVKASAIAK
jgi:hypothetical protein